MNLTRVEFLYTMTLMAIAQFLYLRLTVISCAVAADFLIGDPHWFPHPVKLMGAMISFEEKIIRRFVNSAGGLRVWGGIVTFSNIIVSTGFTLLLLRLLKPYFFLHCAAEVAIATTCLAARSLDYETMQVLKALSKDLAAGRKQLSNIVGRDTTALNEKEIYNACIETVAENANDGVIAPLMYLLLFGAAGGIAFKQINTLDSMIGYNNERYKDFGYAAAKTDDFVNFIPSRLSALLLLAAAKLKRKTFSKNDVKRGFAIFKRDRFNHKSPNSAQTESVVAGLLGIQLGGTHLYFGKPVEKPTIGDAVREPEPSDVRKTIQLMYAAELLLLIAAGLLSALLFLSCGGFYF